MDQHAQPHLTTNLWPPTLPHATESEVFCGTSFSSAGSNKVSCRSSKMIAVFSIFFHEVIFVSSIHRLLTFCQEQISLNPSVKT